MKNFFKQVAITVFLVYFFVIQVSFLANGSVGGSSSSGGSNSSGNSTSGGNSNSGNFTGYNRAIDTNDNGIADGSEDWDNDGIPNKDDSDYAQYLNMQDDDGDGIPNKNDPDYTRPYDGSGTQNQNQNQNKNAVNKPDFQQSKNTLRSRLGVKNSAVVDRLMIRFQNKYQSIPQDEMQQRYQKVLQNIDGAITELHNRNYTNLQKYTFKNAFEYLRLRIQESMQ